MAKSRNKTVNCDKCPQGFVQPIEQIWEMLGIIENYGTNIFINHSISPHGGYVLNINTDTIRNVLTTEGLKVGTIKYKIIFHDLITFLRAGINRMYNDQAIEMEKIKKKK